LTNKNRSIAIIDEQILRESVKLNKALVFEMLKAFTLYSSGKADVPPVMQILSRTSGGQTCVKSAISDELPGYAIKISSNFTGNPAMGVPVGNGLVTLFDTVTGELDSIFLDNGYLTQLRTAAAGGVVADLLARKNAVNICILGTGLQAKLQAEVLMLVRDIEHISIWGRDLDKAARLAETLQSELNVECQAVSDLPSAVSRADIVVTTTTSDKPILMKGWLRPGQHITAMGSDSPGKNEVDPKVAIFVDKYFCDSISQCELLGELHHAKIYEGECGAIQPEELGNVILNKCPGRTTQEEITFMDLTGIGTQDALIALYAKDKLKRKHL